MTKSLRWLLPALLFALFVGLPALARFYTDWLWFGETGYQRVFLTELTTRGWLFSGGLRARLSRAAVQSAPCARRNAPDAGPVGRPAGRARDAAGAPATAAAGRAGFGHRGAATGISGVKPLAADPDVAKRRAVWTGRPGAGTRRRLLRIHAARRGRAGHVAAAPGGAGRDWQHRHLRAGRPNRHEPARRPDDRSPRSAAISRSSPPPPFSCWPSRPGSRRRVSSSPAGR